MKVNLQWIKTNFSKMNQLYFNNELPTPAFSTSHATSYFGAFKSYRDPFAGARAGLPHGMLVMSLQERPELHHLNTLLHEMIHLWQYDNRLPHGHGRDFRIKASELNRYGWGIQRCGGRPTDRAIESYNGVVSTPLRSTSIPCARKRAALQRSVTYLQSLPTLSAVQKRILDLRITELKSLNNA